ncbi:MazG nucleotide pyrophosphohydrolase domain-containing protein [Oryzibacter oryziterrae]|uniref:MazG nucleotide pyrophosphohydrolase domain-containing protein n=1 Tax=Oryzibacter oryziterrae TaxID=2766474 RepID=UPI001F29D28A|nr:MazG nucleotide pyrophosphohydrolase domain-containing protein [Oryzibacter oryziterrae]
MTELNLNAMAERLEAISSRYAGAFGIDRSGDWFMLKVQEEMGELVQVHLAQTGRSRRPNEGLDERLADEMADVLCQLLVFARAAGVDLDAAVARKWFKWEAAYGLSPGA